MKDSFLWNKVLRYIGRRERCEQEIINYINNFLNSKFKIRNSKFEIRNEKEEIGKIIEKLKKLDLINDDRFTKFYVHDAYELQHKGKNRIKYELTNKRVNELTIDKYLNEIESEDEKTQALKFARKKYELMKKLPFLTVKRRLYGQLVRRGFSPQIVRETIDRILKKR